MIVTDIVGLEIQIDGEPNHIKSGFCHVMYPTIFINMFSQVAGSEIILNISSPNFPWNICHVAYPGDFAIIFSRGRKGSRKNIENVVQNRVNSISVFFMMSSQNDSFGYLSVLCLSIFFERREGFDSAVVIRAEFKHVYIIVDTIYGPRSIYCSLPVNTIRTY